LCSRRVTTPDDSNIDNNTNNNNDDDEDDELPQPPAPKGVFARLRDKFASTFELGSLGSQQGNGVPQVVSVRNSLFIDLLLID
jgi:hypothetical protein